MSLDHPYQNFDDFVWQRRFLRSDVVKQVMSYITELASSKDISSTTVILHTAYPRQKQILVQKLTDDEDVSESGLGAGKSDLLRFISSKLSELNFTVWTSQEIENDDESRESYYKDVFLTDLVKRNQHLLISRLQKVRLWLEFVWSRLSLFFSVAIAPLIVILTYLLAWLGFDAIEFVIEPKNNPVIVTASGIFAHYKNEFFIVGLALLAAWLPYSWGELQRKKEAREQWDTLKTNYEAARSTETAIESLVNQPKRLLRSLSRKAQRVAVLIDDFDTIDEASAQKFAKLADTANELQICKFLFLVAYNPSNPVLNYGSKHWLCEEFSQPRIHERDWHSIQLNPINKRQLTELLWQYYQDERAQAFQTHLETTFSEAQTNTGLLLAFFRSQDRKASLSEPFLNTALAELQTDFIAFLEHDRRLIATSLQLIRDNAGVYVEGCKEMLKYVLAHRDGRGRRHLVKVNNITKLMAGKSEQEISACLTILSASEINLLQITKESNEKYIEFRQGYMYTILNSGWQEWRQDTKKYYSEVLQLLHEQRKGDEELAIRSSPSKLAVSALWRAGEYYFRFAGASPINIALRYYEDGLRKLLHLIDEAFANHQNPWELMRTGSWKAKDVAAEINPLRQLRQQSGKSYSLSRYGEEYNLLAFHLLYVVGRLKWLQGDWQTANDLWTAKWPEVAQRLSQYASSPQDSQQLSAAGFAIHVARAEMLYMRGGASDWDEALDVCNRARALMPQNNSMSLLTIYETLIRFYRKYGTGNELPPLRFLKSSTDMTEIVRLSSDQSLPLIERLRLLTLCARGYWQMIRVDLPNLSQLDLSKSYALNFDQSAWNALTNVLPKQAALLAEATNGSSPKRSLWNLWPDARSEEAWLLLWEGYYLLYRYHDYQLTVTMYYMEFHALFQSRAVRGASERIDALFSLMHKMRTYLANACIDCLQRSQSFMQLANKFEAYVNSQSDNRPNQRRRKEEVLRDWICKLYGLGAESLYKAAMERMNYAELAFRDLGHQPGVMAAKYGRFQAARAAQDRDIAHTDKTWRYELNRFFRDQDDSLGYHLDHLLMLLHDGRWGEMNDVPHAADAFYKALKWTSQPTSGLPPAINGEVNFRIGWVLGSGESGSTQPQEIIVYFDHAKAVFESDDVTAVMSEQLLADRSISIVWWRAELYVRSAQITQEPRVRKYRLKQAIENSDFVIRRANEKDTRNSARLVKGTAWAALGNVFHAFREYSLAVDYFVAENNTFWSLQTLTRLINLVATERNLKEKTWHDLQDQALSKYWPLFITALGDYERKHEQLTYAEKLIFYRASRLAGHCINGTDPTVVEKSIHWLESAFTTLEELGLHGLAVSLTPILRQRYLALGDPAKAMDYLSRVVVALQRLDPAYDVIPEAEILNSILQALGLKTAFERTEHLKTKEELLQTAKNAISLPTRDYKSAIDLLERARALQMTETFDEIDLQVLDLLRTVYYKTGDLNRAKEVSEAAIYGKAYARCSALVELAMYFKSRNLPYRGILKSATMTPLDSDCFQRATIELAALQGEI